MLIALVAAAAAYFGAAFLEQVSVHLFPSAPQTQCIAVRRDYSHSVALAVVVVCLFAPLAEESIFRGFVYGYGQAMTEELIHEDGRIVTSSLAEYKLPTQMDIPPIRMILLPAEVGPGPFGAKSVGENTNIGVGAAIANAIFDAVGVRINVSPITAERVYAGLQERDGHQ